MENTDGKGKRLTPATLASLLRNAANEIEAGGSHEGSIAWETPTQDFDRRFEVLAFYRTGQNMGQGGCIVIREES